MALLVFVDFRRGADFLNLGASAASDVLITGLDEHVALLAEGLEILAHCGFHALAVDLIADFILDLGE